MATPIKFDIKASKKVGALTAALMTLIDSKLTVRKPNVFRLGIAYVSFTNRHCTGRWHFNEID